MVQFLYNEILGQDDVDDLLVLDLVNKVKDIKPTALAVHIVDPSTYSVRELSEIVKSKRRCPDRSALELRQWGEVYRTVLYSRIEPIG